MLELKRISSILIVVSMIACGESATVPGPLLDVGPGSSAPFLTPGLAASIADNHIPIAAPIVPPGTAIISAERATALAIAYAKQFGPYVRNDLEAFRGARIDWSTLATSDDVMVVQSAYEPVDPSAPELLRKAAGPYYLVTLLQGDRPTLIVAVSALATDVDLVGGRIRRPVVRGHEFSLGAIDLSGRGRPVSVEEAVRIAGTATGARVAAIPTLRSRGIQWSPRTGYWTVQLDRPVPVASPTGVRVVGRVYIGHDRKVSADPPNAVDAITLHIGTVRAGEMPPRSYQLQPVR